MKRVVEVQQCYNQCPFFWSSQDGMYCKHPYWKDKDAYEDMIITHTNSHEGRFPEKCPLRTEELVVTYKLGCNNQSELKDDSPQCVGISLFSEALRIMRDLAELQNGAPLVTYEADWNKTMSEVWSFLEANEGQNIRQNEEQIRNCETCKHYGHPKSFRRCFLCYSACNWEAITIVPTEGHSD